MELNTEQLHAYSNVDSTITKEQLLLYGGGVEGTGKSHVVRTIV